MKIVFFDMEFANGRVPGSVYSLGYVKTNERFALTEPQTDLLINPDCEWNAYVRSHILAYSMDTVKQASLFPAYYKRLRRLLCGADLVVGFAVKNDTVALERACQRYGLKPLSFLCLDMERLCKALKDYPEAHGLAGYVRAYCGIEPDHQHRSDGDAYATMMLLREICKRRGISPKQVKKEFARFLIPSISPAPKKKTDAEEGGASGALRKSKRTDSMRSCKSTTDQDKTVRATPNVAGASGQASHRRRAHTNQTERVSIPKGAGTKKQ